MEELKILAKSTKEELDDVRDDVADAKTQIAVVVERVRHVTDAFDGLRADLREFKLEVPKTIDPLREDIRDLKQEMKGLRETMEGLGKSSSQHKNGKRDPSSDSFAKPNEQGSVRVTLTMREVMILAGSVGGVGAFLKAFWKDLVEMFHK